VRHDIYVGRLLAVTLLVVTAACADEPRPPQHQSTRASSGIPNVAEIVCEADGSTTVETPEVLVQADGIHVHVVNHLNEPASVGAFGLDAEPGETDFVSVAAPGSVDAACYPYSEHSGGEEPAAQPVSVLDPEGTYVGGELKCSGTSTGTINDFFRPSLEVGPVPLGDARAAIKGLQAGDELIRTGYPKQPHRGIVVSREGVLVASFSFVTFDGEEWLVEGSNICSSSGLS
jgi:hypothetical protein